MDVLYLKSDGDLQWFDDHKKFSFIGSKVSDYIRNGKLVRVISLNKRHSDLEELIARDEQGLFVPTTIEESEEGLFVKQELPGTNVTYGDVLPRYLPDDLGLIMCKNDLYDYVDEHIIDPTDLAKLDTALLEFQKSSDIYIKGLVPPERFVTGHIDPLSVTVGKKSPDDDVMLYSIFPAVTICNTLQLLSQNPFKQESYKNKLYELTGCDLTDPNIVHSHDVMEVLKPYFTNN